MVQTLLQVRAHLIMCFRAEEKIEMVRGDNGKLQIVPKVTPTGIDGWVPICEKNLPYELTASFLLLAAHPGIPKPIKLQEQHRALFPLDRPITEESGRKIAEWAAGGAARKESAPEQKSEAVRPDQPEQSDQSHPVPAADPADDPFDPLLVQGREWAEQGVEKYRAWWTRLTKEQRSHVGEARHEAFKALASKVPA
jgi:hypothetical protein